MKNFAYFKLSIILILIGCCKDRTDDIKTNDIKVECGRIAEAPKDFKDYFIFNQGSWWKYNLVGTSDTDKRTVVELTKISYDIKASANFGILPCIYIYKCISDHTHSSFKNSYQIFGDALDLRPIGDSLNWQISHATQSNYNSLDIFSSWPLVNKFNYGLYIIDSLDAEVNINGNDLECIKIKKITASASDSNYIGAAYFSKKIGLVKYTVLPDKTWILKEHQIK